jgi:hypothetical protein
MSEELENQTPPENQTPAEQPETPAKPVLAKPAKTGPAKKPAFNPFGNNKNSFQSNKFGGSSSRKGNAYRGGGVKKGK